MAYSISSNSIPYIQDVDTMPLDEQTKYIVRMARQANDNLLENTEGAGDWMHYCPFFPVFSPFEKGSVTRDRYMKQQYWLSALNEAVYCGVNRNNGWRFCKRCNPEQLSRNEVRNRIAGRKILRFLRSKVSIIKFKRSATTFAALHLRRELPADIVSKVLSYV